MLTTNMLRKISLKKVTIQAADGSFHELTPVNILDRTHLFKTLEEMQEILASYSSEELAELTFEDIFDSDDYFRHVCCQAVALGGLDPDILSLDVIYCLLMPFYDEESQTFHRQGILIDLNFSPRIAQLNKNDKEEANSTKETLAELLGGLWASTNSVTEAMELIEGVPADELIEVLQYRAKIQGEANKTPEQKKAEKQKQERDALKEKLQKRREKFAGTRGQRRGSTPINPNNELRNIPGR